MVKAIPGFYWRSFLLFAAAATLCSLIIACKKNKIDKPDDHHDTDYTSVLFVANEKAGNVSVIDASNYQLIKTIHIMEGTKMLMAHNVQVAPNGKTVWVTAVPEMDGEFEWVFVIDASDLTLKTKIRLGTHQHLAHVVLDDRSEFAYVTANRSHEVIKIDARAYTEVKRFYLGSTYEPHGLRYSDNKLYVACMNAKSVAIIDLLTEQLSEFMTGGVTVQTAVAPDGRYVFATCYDTKELAIYDPVTEEVKKTQLPDGAQGPIQIYPTPDSKFLYVCDQGMLDNRPVSNKVFVFDIASFSFIKTITTGNAAHGVVADNTGTRAYVTNSNDNTVSVIDIASNTVVKTIPVDARPNGISYWFKHDGVTGGMK